MPTIFSEVDVAINNRSLFKEVFRTVVYATSDPNTADECGLPKDFKLTKWCVPSKFEQYAERIQNFNVRPDDIWLVGYMKSGTTWMHNIVWQLRNNFEFSASPIGYADDVFEMTIYDTAHSDTYFDDLDKLPSPRIFRTHLPVYLLPKELWTVRPKIIYTARNPKDIAVSLFYFGNALREAHIPRELIFEACLKEIATLSPIHAHVLSFWELRKLNHVKFFKYEDLLADPFGNLKLISEFLDCSSTDQEIRDLVNCVSFENMKAKIGTVSIDGRNMKESEFYFCRKGKAGGYRDEMTEEYIKRFDDWTADRLKNSDFTYANV